MLLATPFLENYQKTKGSLMDPKSFYQKTIQAHAVELNRLKKRAFFLSMFRLIIFLLIILMVYLFVDNTPVISTTIVAGIAFFLFLVSWYTDIKNKRNYYQLLVEINKRELDISVGNLEGLDTGDEFIFEGHHYNQDIDLFGQGSLFQLLNRTGTRNGKTKLAAWLNSNDISTVKEKQEAVDEMSQKAEWRQHFEASAKIIENEVNSDEIINWIKSYESQIPKAFSRIPLIFSILSFGMIAAWGAGYLAGIYLGIWFFVGLGITGLYLKKVAKLYKDCGKTQETFAQYSKLILAIENLEVTASHLKTKKAQLDSETGLASSVLRELSSEISSLDQRNNVFFGLIANGFFLWDLRYSYRIEAWMSKFESALDEWFDAVSYFDSINSLGNFKFNYPEYIFPSISIEASEMLKANQIGHPLLLNKKRIDNDLKMSVEDFFIITGANMAGKSTFLRTVALNLVMANCGLPVCAKSFKYRPIKLISSMRTSDSLQNDESYFFSELKRLKFIVDEIQSDTYFIILDEILKGTNSKDKAEGSQKFVERLVASNSTGLIATHDLSLCKLSEKLPQIENHYFDAEIVDDELYFDYTFKDGICQNMNASFLLKKMEIV